MARVKENKRIIRTLSQVSIVNLSSGISNGGHVRPLCNPKVRDDVRNQRRTLNRTRHLKICQPLPNHSLDTGDLDLSDHGI
jgi:hypothetical protein